MGSVLVCVTAWVWPAEAFDREAYEESGGTACQVQAAPSEAIYGLAFTDGTWLVGAPVFAEYGVSLFSDGESEGLFGGAGMTLRVMPRGAVAPFAGIGGCYNHRFEGEEPGGTLPVGASRPPRQESYWAGLFEGGLRVRVGAGGRFVEAAGRYVLPGLADEPGYWLLTVSYGFLP